MEKKNLLESFTLKMEERESSFYFKKKVVLLLWHKSHGTTEFTDCGIQAGED